MTSILDTHRTCLNGWWDFQPVFGDPPQPEPCSVPQGGWAPRAYLVPSWWTKPKDAVRLPGELRFKPLPTWDELRDDHEVLFDAYAYPMAWARTRAGWARRVFVAAAAVPGRRRHLVLEGLMPRGWVFVNGVRVAYHVHPTLPLRVDIEDHLRPGENELAVRIADYERDGQINHHSKAGRMLTPTGNWIPCDHSGLWQDAWLEERGEVRVVGCTIDTSVRRSQLRVRWEVANDGPIQRRVRLMAEVAPWVRSGRAEALFHLPGCDLDLAPGEMRTVVSEVPWPNPRLWSTEDPALHELRTSLAGEGGEMHRERFGFREVWIDGPDLMLNGHPIHLFSDWGHKTTPYYLTESWTRQWFAMMRDANLNHTRLHTHPHPRLILDLADEAGILVTGECGIHGSGGEQGADDPLYWERAEDHVRRFVERDRNHPAVILWSVENEMRWNRDTSTLTRERLPRLRQLFHELDPSRPAYHEGDSSLWPEGDQAILSRHYGDECSGLGWWDQRQPLHSGEMSLYHYSGPNNTFHLAGDRAWSAWSAVEVAAATDTAWVVEGGRTQGVCCFGPWNLSCLQNLRPHPAVRLDYADWSAPGAKPLQVPACSSEFRFWEGGSGYTPDVGFAIQAQSFRPLAVIDLNLRSGQVPGGRFTRTVHVVNDSTGPVEGELLLRLSRSGSAPLIQVRHAVRLGRGRRCALPVDAVLACDAPTGLYDWEASFIDRSGDRRDGWTRQVLIDAPRAAAIDGLAVHGDGSSDQLWPLVGLCPRRLATLEDLSSVRVLVIERGLVRSGSAINQILARFCAAGGRVLLLEQETSVFPGLRLEAKSVRTAFVRAPHHRSMAGIGDVDLRFWGDAGYAHAGGDTAVADRCYRKGDGSALALCDTGVGSFGHGSCDFAPLIEVRHGAGVLIGCQFLVTGKAAAHPAARRLLCNLLGHLAAWQAPAVQRIITATAEAVPAGLVEEARRGAVVCVGPLDAAGLATWATATGVALRPVELPDTWQIVRSGCDQLLDGLSHEDGCGVERWTYCGAEAADHRVGSTFIAPADGLESWWETPTASCLAEMFPHGGRTEPLRAHTRTRFLGAERPQHAVAVGRIRIGAGQIILSQFAPPQATDGALLRERHARLRLRLRANLGEAPRDLLAGAIAGAAARSAGHPTTVQIFDGPCDDGLAERLRQATRPGLERLLNRPILLLAAWRGLEGRDGRWTFPATAADRWIYLVVDTPVARRNDVTNLGVPNPEALTFLDLGGAGRVELVINGVRRPDVTLPGTATDIALERGWNHLLLRWRGGGDDLELRFRTIMRKPEQEFAFA